MSRPGVNADNPHDTTPEYLALYSEWPKVERLVDLIRVKNTTLQAGQTVRFDTQPDYPFIKMLIVQHGGNTFYDDLFWSIYTNDASGTYQRVSQKFVVRYSNFNSARIEATTGWAPYDYPNLNKIKFDFIVAVFAP